LGLNQVAESATGLEPVRLGEVLREFLDTLIKCHVQNALLIEHIE